MHDWITIELAIRIRHSKGYKNITESMKKFLRIVRLVLFSLLFVAFGTFAASVTVTAHFEKNYGYAFFNE